MDAELDADEAAEEPLAALLLESLVLWLAPEGLALESSVDELVELLDAEEADEAEDDEDDGDEEADESLDDEAEAEVPADVSLLDEFDAEDADDVADDDDDEEEDDEEDEEDGEDDELSSLLSSLLPPPRSSPAGSSAPLRLRMTWARLDSRIIGCPFWKNLPFQSCRFRASPQTPVFPKISGVLDRQSPGVG